MYFWKDIGYQITDIDGFVQAVHKHRIKYNVIEKYEIEYDNKKKNKKKKKKQEKKKDNDEQNKE